LKVKILIDLDYFKSISEDLDIDRYTVLSVEDTEEQDKLKYEYYQKRIKRNEEKSPKGSG